MVRCRRTPRKVPERSNQLGSCRGSFYYIQYTLLHPLRLLLVNSHSFATSHSRKQAFFYIYPPSFSQFTCRGFEERKHQSRISKQRNSKRTVQQRLHLETQREMTTKSPFVQDCSQFVCLGQRGLPCLPEPHCLPQSKKLWRHNRAK